jgi:hypothetical protein
MINTADPYSGSPGFEYWHRTGRTDLDLSRTCSEHQISAEMQQRKQSVNSSQHRISLHPSTRKCCELCS